MKFCQSRYIFFYFTPKTKELNRGGCSLRLTKLAATVGSPSLSHFFGRWPKFYYRFWTDDLQFYVMIEWLVFLLVFFCLLTCLFVYLFVYFFIKLLLSVKANCKNLVWFYKLINYVLTSIAEYTSINFGVKFQNLIHF